MESLLRLARRLWPRLSVAEVPAVPGEEVARRQGGRGPPEASAKAA